MDFTEFKNTHFDGDEDKALECLAHEGYVKQFNITGDGRNLQSILDTMDEDTADKYMEFLDAEIDKNPKIFEGIFKKAKKAASLGMTYEEILKSQKNPYVKKLFMNLIILIFGSFVILVLSSMISGTALGKSGIGTLIACFAALFIAVYFFKTVQMLLNILKFNKVKKQAESDETISINIEKESQQD